MGLARPHRRLGFKSSRAPLLVVPAAPAAFSAVSALAPRARSLSCIGKWRSGHCLRLRPKSAFFLKELRVVPVVRVLDVSRLLEHDWCDAAVGFLWRALVTLSRFCVSSSLLRQRRGWFFLIRLRLRRDYCVTCVQPVSQKKNHNDKEVGIDRISSNRSSG